MYFLIANWFRPDKDHLPASLLNRVHHNRGGLLFRRYEAGMGGMVGFWTIIFSWGLFGTYFKEFYSIVLFRDIGIRGYMRQSLYMLQYPYCGRRGI